MIKWIKNLGLKWKFVLAFYIVLILPMTIVGIYINRQMSSSIIAQNRIRVEQDLEKIKNQILHKITLLESIAEIVIYDNRILNFMENEYIASPEQIQTLNMDISTSIDIICAKNKIINKMRIFFINETLPESWDFIYNIERIENDDWYKSFVANRDSKILWRMNQKRLDLPIDLDITKNAFSYSRKIYSFITDRFIGVLDIEIDEKVLFEEIIKLDKNIYGEVFLFNNEGEIIVSNSDNFGRIQLENTIIENINSISKSDNSKAVIVSMPVGEIQGYLVNVKADSAYLKQLDETARYILIISIFLSIILGVVIYMMVSILLKRLEVLVVAMRTVHSESYNVVIESSSKDEFGELASSFNYMTKKIHTLIEKVYKIELMEKESQLKALESQINPHFLYNTLTTVTFMAQKANSKVIMDISQSLAKFYRLVLSKGKSVVCLKNEIEQLEAYIKIQKIRFEDIFDIEINYETKSLNLIVIKNILQPIVENSLYHGIEPKGSFGKIKVDIYENENDLYIKVCDDGVGMTKETIERIKCGDIDRKESNGYAIKNINDRIIGFYGENYGISIISELDKGTEVTILVPKRYIEE